MSTASPTVLKNSLKRRKTHQKCPTELPNATSFWGWQSPAGERVTPKYAPVVDNEVTTGSARRGRDREGQCGCRWVGSPPPRSQLRGAGAPTGTMDTRGLARGSWRENPQPGGVTLPRPQETVGTGQGPHSWAMVVTPQHQRGPGKQKLVFCAHLGTQRCSHGPTVPLGDPQSWGPTLGTPPCSSHPAPRALGLRPTDPDLSQPPTGGGTGVQTTARGEHEENTVPFSTRKGAWRELAVKLGHKSPRRPLPAPAGHPTRPQPPVTPFWVTMGRGPSFLHPRAHVETRDEVTHLPCPSLPPPHECAHTRSHFLVFSF